jgi:hypothetical protein
MRSTTSIDQGPTTALLADTGLEPFQVTRKQLHQMFNSPAQVKQMIAAGWIKQVRPGRPGRETLFDYQSAKAAYERLRVGEEPPPTPTLARVTETTQEPT